MGPKFAVLLWYWVKNSQYSCSNASNFLESTTVMGRRRSMRQYHGMIQVFMNIRNVLNSTMKLRMPRFRCTPIDKR